MKTILCDLDGVVTDFWAPLMRDYNRKTGASITIANMTDWHVEKCLPRGDLMQAAIDAPGLFKYLRPLPGAIEGLKALRAAGHDVYIVSAGKLHALAEKSEWVSRHLPFMRNRVIFTEGKTPKSLIRGDVLIDDGPHNLIGAKEAGRTTVACWYKYTEPARQHCDYIVPMAKRPLLAWGAIVKLFEGELA